MGALKNLLEQLPQIVRPGGRAAIITFHSIEDRLVKVFFKKGTFEEEVENPFEMKTFQNPFKLVNKKPIEATAAELKQNSRARSAKLRVAERVGE